MCNYIEEYHTVSSVEIDLWGRMKATSILNICQEIAYRDSTLRGVGYETLHSLNLSWVLSRMRVEIDRLPVWNEVIRVRSWHKRESGVFSLRDYIFFDSNDIPIIRTTSSWLIIDINSRRITRTDRVVDADGRKIVFTSDPNDALECEAEKLTHSTDSEIVDTHRVKYSDLDLNHHVNNTRYLEWACDLSPELLDECSSLRSVSINFNHEATYDQNVTLSQSSPADGTRLIDGSIGDRNIFVTSLKYEGKK